VRTTGTLLIDALRQAPRRYRMPPLPATPEGAWAAGTETALAFAIETARTGAHAAAGRDLFLRALAALIRDALAPPSGDPAFQALVLQAHDADVGEYVRLMAQVNADGRSVRGLVNGFAHPARLPAGAPLRDALAALHQATRDEDWTAVAERARRLRADQAHEPALREALGRLLDAPPLQRLLRAQTLQPLAAVQRFRALRELQGPLAGSAAAAAQGRAAARVGDDAEALTAAAFHRVADLLDAHEGAPVFHVVQGLRTPPGFPGDGTKAKDEWDCALARTTPDALHLVLLAEVKAAVAAATPDYARLHRGLLRLAHADPHQAYSFAAANGEVRIAGASLRALAPHGRALPPQVIYCCAAAPESPPQVLTAAARAVLLAEPHSLAFADAIQRGGTSADTERLAPVWEALRTEPRLRAALHQFDTAVAARAAMLHPEDLVAAVEAAARPG
jgi:hypothetical protein